VLQAVIHLHFTLAQQAVGDVDVACKPGGVEDVEVVGVDGCLVAFAQGVAGEEDGEGAAVFELAGARDDRVELFVVTPVAVNRVQAGRAAGGFVGLRQDLDGQLK
jgi:hypothetical protein